MAMIPVRDINLKNQEFIEILDEYKDYLMQRKNPDDDPYVSKVLPVGCPDINAEDWVSDAKMYQVMNQGERHEGFPEKMKGINGLKYMNSNNLEDPMAPDIKEKTKEINSKLIEFLSCKNNALNACYPPGGLISWHNNANAPGYNIIITWSETGDGWFDYWDLDKKERVRIQDKPGWQAKMTYFGPYSKPDTLCYHAAYTDCWRITIAFVFLEADEFWREVIEDLETEN